jgi:Ca-activated chloride channel family protein
MRLLLRLSCVLLLLQVAVTGSNAQGERALLADAGTAAAETGPSQRSFVFRSDVEEVQVRFVAIDKKGQPATSLRAQDVQVITDGKDPAPIKSFVQLRSAPVTLGVLIDMSESIRPEMQLQELAFTEGIADILEPQRDRSFLVAFSAHVSVLQGPTSDFARIKNAIQQPAGSHTLTSLYDALVQTCRELFGPPHSGLEEHRILSLFSDGMDNLSIHSLDDAIDAAVRAGVTIYAVAPENGPFEGRSVLRTLTERTGGRLELLKKREQPEQSVASVRTLIDGEYALSFRPPNDQPGEHSVQLKADLPVVLYAQKEYFVAPQRP